ncbi:NAD(P)-binding protein [Halosegnis rubeus]|jgi:predicted NAD/FAD-dependent oxidoreductase|uniref:NAD(P)-binding protein n=1 Tax=Halosegnis rubeus TaxID=2212850 RepID=A0A5N5U9G0_9EURY|nr:NAD(P)-binding protein [Halosegnis rubeus]KAB7515286.1 NAD(P)-binding protein [Halosegnis rubeus]KAB7516340.1 NAD(P)-binding protein [Halosegnis rubeus]KAB7517672.1 NAD(P)-binding protein [Halosegnis rubeus]
MPAIGVIGAGAASAAATYVLDTALPEASVTVLEKSGGVCGRAATRRRGDYEYVYDYGANYVKDDDERVTDLLTEQLDSDGLVDASEPIYVFEDDGEIQEGRDADDHKWSYERGLTQIAKRLFGETDADIHRRTRVETIERDGEQWRLHATDGGGGDSASDATAGDSWGPFDALLVNPPAPQTAQLLRDADWDHDVRETLAEACEAVPYRSVYTTVLGYEFDLDAPYYGLVNVDKNHEVGWLSREECKAGHVPDGQSVLVVQANHQWSLDHYDDDPESNVAALADHAADIVGDDRLRDPAWSDHQGWRYALPDDGVAHGPVDSAESHGLYCLGDWVGGEARLHVALRNGLDTGERLAYSL